MNLRMKLVSETRGVELLGRMRREFAELIRRSFEHKARPCSACPTPGICCLDAHFVNVRVTRLEAAAICESLDRLPTATRDAVAERAEFAVEIYGLSGPGDPDAKTYACPLFQKGVGCLVHDTAKPLPCIAHACYESEADLPPDELLEAYQQKVADLNRSVYGRDALPAPLPLAIARQPRTPAASRIS